MEEIEVHHPIETQVHHYVGTEVPITIEVTPHMATEALATDGMEVTPQV